MNPAPIIGLTVALVCLTGILGISPTADAAEPAVSPPTLWNFLGIPQGFQKMRDVGVNRRGNFPRLERKPPLKRIGIKPGNISTA